MKSSMGVSLFMDALTGKEVERPPVWMMRQAGRYLPEYRKLQSRYSFFERVKTPELACEITLQPIRRFGLDASIIFSDILVVLECLHLDVQLIPEKGPVINNPIRSASAAMSMEFVSPVDTLDYVYSAIKVTREALPAHVPLIGFAGAPWTLFCYAVQGEGSKTFSKAKSFLFSQPEAADRVLSLLTQITIEYLHEQVKAGAQALQLFESWAAALAPDDFEAWALPHINKILAEDYGVPVILFCKDMEWVYSRLGNSSVAAFGIGWGCTPEKAREYAGEKVVQGNLDPSKLLSAPAEIEKETIRMIERFGKQRYIANLGHGILPEVPVENARIFIETIQNYKD